MPINPQWTFGLGVNVPFGLKTEYDDGWLGRYQALKSKIETINVNPALSWQVTPTLALGAGVNYQRIKATLTNNVNYSGALLQAAAGPPANIAPGSPTFNAIAGLTGGLDSLQTVTGDDDTWGWNVGLAWDATPQLRVAASYRSAMKYNVSGNLDLRQSHGDAAARHAGAIGRDDCPALGGRQQQGDVQPRRHLRHQAAADGQLLVPLPARPAMGADGRRAVHGLVEHPGTQVHRDRRLRVQRGGAQLAEYVQVRARRELSVQRAVEVARLAVAFDQTPANDTNTTVRLPDSDRWWLTLGGEYRATPNWKFDAGFAYIFADSPSFNQNQGSTASNGLIKGSYDASVWILSVQAVYVF